MRGPMRSAARFAFAVLLLMAASTPIFAQGATVYEGARIIVGDGSAPIEDAVIVVDGNRFAQVGRKDQVTVPAGATRVDLTGKTVIPALVDGYGHPGFLDAVTGTMSKANFT